MNLKTSAVSRSGSPRLRSGTAARLAGLPVSTLRVWERRYGIAESASRTDSGQRLYRLEDVTRLRLLRHLTQDGHAIGTIAGLPLRSLQALAEGLPPPEAAAPDTTLQAVVIGPSAAHALRQVAGCQLRAVHPDLAAAEAAPRGEPPPELLVVRLASLQPADVDRLARLAAKLAAPSVLVVYAFGTDSSADALRASGATVCREPFGDGELSEWVQGVRAAPAPGKPPAAASPAEAGAKVAPRRFSDEALAQLVRMPSPVACECLRHMAEIVAQLAGFERYSQDCLPNDPADVDLHRELGRTAGAARTMFEEALQRVVGEARLELLPSPPG